MTLPETLVLVRHAESERNMARRVGVFLADAAAREEMGGRPDHHVLLTARGEAQAEAVGRLLRARGVCFDAAYDSGYVRTVDTLTGLLAAWPEGERPPRATDLTLRERDIGYSWNMTADEARTAFPWLQGHWDTAGPFFGKPPGGESVADVCVRVRAFLERMRREHGGRRVLAVTHGRTIAAFRAVLEGWDIARAEAYLNGPSARNASVTVYDRAGEGFALREYDVVADV
ncbi:MAG: histidine phosphatase family protein [Polyangiales bacterium]